VGVAVEELVAQLEEKLGVEVMEVEIHMQGSILHQRNY
jgi:cell division ATPase FtsA